MACVGRIERFHLRLAVVCPGPKRHAAGERRAIRRGDRVRTCVEEGSPGDRGSDARGRRPRCQGARGRPGSRSDGAPPRRPLARRALRGVARAGATGDATCGAESPRLPRPPAPVSPGGRARHTRALGGGAWGEGTGQTDGRFAATPDAAPSSRGGGPLLARERPRAPPSRSGVGRRGRPVSPADACGWGERGAGSGKWSAEPPRPPNLCADSDQNCFFLILRLGSCITSANGVVVT